MEKSQDGRWKKGESGNPSGRAAGSRNRATLAIEALLEGEGEALTRKAIELAKSGGAMVFGMGMAVGPRPLPRPGRPSQGSPLALVWSATTVMFRVLSAAKEHVGKIKTDNRAHADQFGITLSKKQGLISPRPATAIQ